MPDAADNSKKRTASAVEWKRVNIQEVLSAVTDLIVWIWCDAEMIIRSVLYQLLLGTASVANWKMAGYTYHSGGWLQ